MTFSKKQFITSIILSVTAIINIIFLKFIWWKDNGIYVNEGFEDTSGWRYLDLVGRRGTYILGLVLILFSIWLLYITVDITIPILINIVGTLSFSISFFTSSAGQYPLMNSSAGNVTHIFHITRAYAVISIMIIFCYVIVIGLLKRKNVKI